MIVLNWKLLNKSFILSKVIDKSQKKKYLQYHKNEEEKFEDKYVLKFPAFFSRFFASIEYKTFLSILIPFSADYYFRK